MDHERLLRWLPARLRAGRAPRERWRGERKFSEDQITALIGLVTHELASPAEICSRFGVAEDQLYAWWRSALSRTHEDFDEIRRLERENRILKAALKTHGIEPPNGDDHGIK
jgi:transposase-like protein